MIKQYMFSILFQRPLMQNRKNSPSFSLDSSESDVGKECSFTETTQASRNVTPSSFAHMLKSHNIVAHSSLQQNNIPSDSFVFLTPSMQTKIHTFGRVCRLFVISDCLEGQKGHDKICLIVSLNEKLCPQILSVQTFNSLRIKEEKAVIAHLEFLKEKIEFVPQSIFLHSSLHEAVRKYNCLEYEKIAFYHTFTETSQKIKDLFLNETNSSLEKKLFEVEIEDLIEENDRKKCSHILGKLKKISRTRFNYFTTYLSKNTVLFSQIEQQYVGHMLSKQFNREMENFVRSIAKMSIESIHSLIQIVITNECYEKRYKNKIVELQSGRISEDSRISSIKDKYELRPFVEFYRKYKKSEMAKYKKASNFMFIVSNRKGTPWLVEKTEKLFSKNPTFDWKCECLFLQKTGIPCEHLIKVLAIQGLKIDQYMDKNFEKK